MHEAGLLPLLPNLVERHFLYLPVVYQTVEYRIKVIACMEALDVDWVLPRYHDSPLSRRIAPEQGEAT